MFDDITGKKDKLTEKEFKEHFCSVCVDYAECQNDSDVHKAMLKECMANRWSITPKVRFI